METFLRLMGDYGKTARPETIGTCFQQNSNAPSEDVARLNGARFVNISEPDKKLTLSAALVKSLTGNDTITARFLHENSFEYRPQFKMFINTNYLPQITDLTLFSSGRIKPISFERHFEELRAGQKTQIAFRPAGESKRHPQLVHRRAPVVGYREIRRTRNRRASNQGLRTQQ